MLCVQDAARAHEKLLADVETYKRQTEQQYEAVLTDLKQDHWKEQQDMIRDLRLVTTELAEEKVKLPRAEELHTRAIKEVRERFASLQAESSTQIELLSAKLSEASKQMDRATAESAAKQQQLTELRAEAASSSVTLQGLLETEKARLPQVEIENSKVLEEQRQKHWKRESELQNVVKELELKVQALKSHGEEVERELKHAMEELRQSKWTESHALTNDLRAVQKQLSDLHVHSEHTQLNLERDVERLQRALQRAETSHKVEQSEAEIKYTNDTQMLSIKLDEATRDATKVLKPPRLAMWCVQFTMWLFCRFKNCWRTGCERQKQWSAMRRCMHSGWLRNTNKRLLASPVKHNQSSILWQFVETSVDWLFRICPIIRDYSHGAAE